MSFLWRLPWKREHCAHVSMLMLAFSSEYSWATGCSHLITDFKPVQRWSRHVWHLWRWRGTLTGQQVAVRSLNIHLRMSPLLFLLIIWSMFFFTRTLLFIQEANTWIIDVITFQKKTRRPCSLYAVALSSSSCSFTFCSVWVKTLWCFILRMHCFFLCFAFSLLESKRIVC